MRILRPSALPWLLLPLCAVGFLLWTNSLRVRHLDYVSSLSRESPTIDVTSVTGYAGGTRALIVPAHNRESYDWIALTQQGLAQGESRIRRTDHENAPLGRPVRTPSLYRWWLAGVAWVNHALSDRPLGYAVERAALYADPLLHLLLLAGGTFFVARKFGAFSGGLFGVGAAALFPFAAGFIPGAPDSHALATVLVLVSVLPLLVGVRLLHASPDPTAKFSGAVTWALEPGTDRNARRWFAAAGVAGGIGLWNSVESQVPVIIGIFGGALASAWVARASSTTDAARAAQGGLWRIWGISGAATTFLAYLIEYLPSDWASWDLGVIHPAYGVAWLGLGELAARVNACFSRRRTTWTVRDAVSGGMSLVAVGVVPWIMWQEESRGFLFTNLNSFRLTKLPDGIAAPSLLDWILRDGFTLQVWATLLPMLLILPAGWLVIRHQTSAADRIGVAVALVPLLIACGLGFYYLRWWHLADALLLALLAAIGLAFTRAGFTQKRPVGWAALALFAFVPGLVQLWPSTTAASQTALPILEVEGMLERDLARWLATRVGDPRQAVIWAPPSVTNTLYFYGGLRGLGSFSPDNEEGLSVVLQIARAGSNDEVRALVNSRGITHFVLPSWDTFFDDAVYSAGAAAHGTFLARLQQWAVPSWLRPIPYQFSKFAGIEDYSVTIFEVVEEQDAAVALSRLAEYFAETGQLNRAAAIENDLARFPSDLSALVARAQVTSARGDQAGYARALELLRLRLTSRAERFLPWDRRVSLAIVLAREQQIEDALEQTKRCLAEVTEARLRSLSSGMLFNLQMLARALELQIEDARLRSLAQTLLEPELRRQLLAP